MPLSSCHSKSVVCFWVPIAIDLIVEVPHLLLLIRHGVLIGIKSQCIIMTEAHLSPTPIRGFRTESFKFNPNQSE